MKKCMIPKKDSNEGYDILANDIIMLAVRDYRRALRILRRRAADRNARAMKESCEAFFRSDWFGVLTRTDPDYLIEQVNREAIV